MTTGRDLNMPTSRRGQEGVGIALGREGIQAWKAAGCEIHKNFGSRILSIRLLMKDTKRKDIGVYLVSAYSSIGLAPEAVWKKYLNNLVAGIERKCDYWM